MFESLKLLIPYLDSLWLVAAIPLLKSTPRIIAVLTIISGMIMLRMQAELLAHIGYHNGILNIIDMGVFERGLIVYSIFYLLYLLMLYISPGERTAVVGAASLSIFFLAACTSSVVMLL